MPTTDQLATQLDRLARFEPGPFPVVSLYLNMQPDQHGRDHFEGFLRKELPDRARTYRADGPERDSLNKDVEKIRAHLQSVDPSANGLALFASSGAELFEAVALAAPIDAHRLYISDQPHLYPLARLADEYPRYAVVLADTHLARIFVVAGNAVQQAEEVEGVKTRRHKMGGWSQARYQRHVDNYHQQHAKEVVETVARIVREERVPSLIIAGDDVIVPLLKEQLPQELRERLVDVVKLDIRAAERDVLDTTIAAMRENDADTDRERVEALLGAYRANGLAVVGVADTIRALDIGQVDELVITAAPDTIDPGILARGKAGAESSPAAAEERAAGELVAKAHQTSARIRFIEDPALLAAVGGVGAFLRYKLERTSAEA